VPAALTGTPSFVGGGAFVVGVSAPDETAFFKVAVGLGVAARVDGRADGGGAVDSAALVDGGGEAGAGAVTDAEATTAGDAAAASATV
jgi:hypothetical protein